MTKRPEYGPPGRAGCYWGRWHTVRPGTTDEHELRGIIGMKWEVHTVTENSIDPDDPEHLMVEVPGVERWQSLDSFEWGPEVVKPSWME